MRTSSEQIRFPCLSVTQPIGTFYVGVVAASDLVDISYADVRRIEREKRDVETYLGIERPLNQKRVAEIRKYVSTLDASFPSSIILAVGSGDADYDESRGVLALRRSRDVAKILDGQHRIAGLEDYEADFDVIVTVFVDMDIENQAMVFATINLEQTKVNKSLAYDLYDYVRARSPQKTAHNIARLLHTESGSPLQRRIKILGTATERGETISQATFVDALLPYLSKDWVKDRDDLKRRKKPARAEPWEERELVFRNMFLDDRDPDIARILWNYFAAVDEKWTVYWREPRAGNILNRTTGFRALMRFLPAAYLSVSKPGVVATKNAFAKVFERVRITGPDLNAETYRPGTSGETQLRNDLLGQAGLEE